MIKRLLISFLILFTVNLSLLSAAPNLTAQDITSGVGITSKKGNQIAHALKFTSSEGKTVLLSEFFQNERPTVISMVYYSCPLLCSMLTDGKIDVINQIDQVIGDDYNVISISFDAKDSVQTSSSFREKHLPRITAEGKENWVFLTGSQDMIDALLEDIGYKVMFIPKQGEFAHPSGLVVVRPDGKVSRYLNGMQFPPFDLKMSLIEAKTQEKISLLERSLLFCYSFDPDANSYTIEVLNLMKVAGIMTVIILALWIRFFIKRDKHKRKIKG